jgi:hypothetical protein
LRSIRWTRSWRRSRRFKATMKGIAARPVVLPSEALSDSALQDAFEFCLQAEARDKARACARRAADVLAKVRDTFVAAMRRPGGGACESSC